MGNTYDTEIARIEADHIQTKWRTTEDYRWGYTGDRGDCMYAVCGFEKLIVVLKDCYICSMALR